ncbi:hypothetical protein ColKHC_07205 [Colletotrichum higginsianum]|nr:hypothetical protein ColKHC_07205 [Colletotrichum higginsianum]
MAKMDVVTTVDLTVRLTIKMDAVTIVTTEAADNPTAVMIAPKTGSGTANTTVRPKDRHSPMAG